MGLPEQAFWALGAGVAGLVFAALTAKRVLAKDPGNETMRTIQAHIQEGAMAFLKREYRTLAIFVVAVALVLAFFLTGKIEGLGWKTAVAFVAEASRSAASR